MTPKLKWFLSLALLGFYLPTQAQKPAKNILYADFIGPCYGLSANYERVLFLKNGGGLNVRIGAPVFTALSDDLVGLPSHPGGIVGLQGYWGSGTWKTGLGLNYNLQEAGYPGDRPLSWRHSLHLTAGVRRQPASEGLYIGFYVGAAGYLPNNYSSPELIPSASISLGSTLGGNSAESDTPEISREPKRNLQLTFGANAEAGTATFRIPEDRTFSDSDASVEYVIDYASSSYSNFGFQSDLNLAEKMGVRLGIQLSNERGGFRFEKDIDLAIRPDTTYHSAGFFQYTQTNIQIAPEFRFSTGKRIPVNILAGMFQQFFFSSSIELSERGYGTTPVGLLTEGTYEWLPSRVWGASLGVSAEIPTGKMTAEPYLKLRFSAPGRPSSPDLRDRSLGMGVILWVN